MLVEKRVIRDPKTNTITGIEADDGLDDIREQLEHLRKRIDQEDGWIDGAENLQINTRRLGAITRTLGVSWPVTIRWMTRAEAAHQDSSSTDGKPCGGYRQASNTREHTIVLRRHMLQVDVVQRVLLHEFAHCGQVEQHGHEFDRLYLRDTDQFENDAERKAQALTGHVCIVRERP